MINRVLRVALAAALAAWVLTAIAADPQPPAGSEHSASPEAAADAPASSIEPHAAEHPKVIGFVVPEYPAEQRSANQSGQVDVAMRVRSNGAVASFEIHSAPSPFDRPVREVLPDWIVVPPDCIDLPEDRAEFLFKVAFTAEDGHYYVAIRDARYVALPGKKITAAGSSTSRHAVLLDAKNAAPTFPKEAIRAKIASGLVLARVTVDREGRVIDVEVPFSAPEAYFPDAVKRALMQWQFMPEPDAEPWVACVDIDFSLRDTGRTRVRSPPLPRQSTSSRSPS